MALKRSKLAKIGPNLFRGVFSRIPFCYSEELYGVIKAMLKVSPDLRPTSSELLGIIQTHQKAKKGGNGNYQNEANNANHNSNSVDGQSYLPPQEHSVDSQTHQMASIPSTTKKPSLLINTNLSPKDYNLSSNSKPKQPVSLTPKPQSKTNLLGTIKIPKDLKNLHMSLPESNYTKSYPDGLASKLPPLEGNELAGKNTQSKRDIMLPHLRLMNDQIQSRDKKPEEIIYNYNYAGNGAVKVNGGHPQPRVVENSPQRAAKNGYGPRRVVHAPGDKGLKNNQIGGGARYRAYNSKSLVNQKDLARAKAMDLAGGLGPLPRIRKGKNGGGMPLRGRKKSAVVSGRVGKQNFASKRNIYIYKKPSWWG